MINFSNFPKDLTPAQRAGIKLWEQFIIMAFLNGVIVGVGYLDSYKTITLPDLAIIIVSQMLLAIASSATKYFKASGQQPLSLLVQTAAMEYAKTVPVAPTLSPELSLAQTAVNNMFPLPDPAANLPLVAQQNNKGIDPTNAPPQSVNTEPVLTLNSIPSMPAIKL